MIPADARLIILHPNYVSQHLVFANLLDAEACVYVRFDGQDLGRAELESQLDHELLAQNGQARLGGVQRLILDECDCANPEELADFLSALLRQFENGTIVIATRRPPHTLHENDQLRAQIQFLPIDEALMLWDYAHREVKSDEGQVLLEVRALGNGRVLKDGKSVDAWDGLLPRSLFFYLVDKGMTTRNDIFETFWPSLSIREATNVFHVTKRKISEVLGVDLTDYWSGFYHISSKIELSYDVVRFSELLQDSAIASLDVAADMLQRALLLYRDDYLTSMQMPWVMARRDELRQSLAEVLIGLAKAMQEQDRLERSLGLYLRAALTNPQREDVAREAMLLYQSMGMPEDALRVYKRLHDEVQTSLGVAPDPKLREIAGELERQLVKGG
jgi:DNA-binding SARP family transcriptional activator